jgi:hypothetical protein
MRLSNRYLDHPDEELLRKLWHIRVEHLKLAKNEKQDWETFAGLFGDDETGVVVFEDVDQEPQGFYSMTMIPVSHEGRKAVMLNAKYWYVRKAYRGGPGALLSGFKLLFRAVRRHGFCSLYFVTTSFPMSYASLTRSIGQSYCLQQTDTPDWERYALTVFGRRYADFNPELGFVLGQAVPDRVAPPSVEAERLIREYEQLNPRWQEGRSMPLLLPVNARTVVHALRRTLRRWWRGRSRRSASKT